MKMTYQASIRSVSSPCCCCRFGCAMGITTRLKLAPAAATFVMAPCGGTVMAGVATLRLPCATVMDVVVAVQRTVHVVL
jgi:hypothetical protein